MARDLNLSIPLDLADQVRGLPTLPSDRGDETQDRFRYQWAMAVVLLAEGITELAATELAHTQFIIIDNEFTEPPIGMNIELHVRHMANGSNVYPPLIPYLVNSQAKSSYLL